MKAIEILEAISTKIKEGEYVGNIGIIVQIKDDEMLEEGKKAKSILEAFDERVELKVVEAGNYQLLDRLEKIWKNNVTNTVIMIV